ncbi:decarboxylating NADP(+)-dependent phosphogluconate dehydrogenase [Candidatus Similichlamydia laticola]|uniref:6-phosphogluconate dehydrogenase, decarboxylating n=1 Tax=Candidatus Similichlamydia laticola TaxID=2170265 RepID=A0A369KIZ3_9BACT|nr:decarboxylating NADP(+)-dependent phosphogluconate dehydrogenase [Candidatus Similichlamydia laticola]RDB31753.1 6-phosphogluconate dehydrogenase, decarboxylating [Candidatus Similichlamydia laticola]
MPDHQEESDLGIVGLGTMGASLALNFADHQYRVVVYNRTTSKAENFFAKYKDRYPLQLARSLEDFVKKLRRPRNILLMVSAGSALDKILEQLVPLLEEGDLIVDGGNSHFLDTERRMQALVEKNILYVGCGISGGEEGARHGPAMMPSGAEASRQRVESLLASVAARDEEGHACCRWIGSGGSGHYVKMVHNGIEYVEMQLLAEAYDLLRRGFGLNCSEIASIFSHWQSASWGGFLLDASIRVLRHHGERKECLVDEILDEASQKGTGRWSTSDSLELGVPVPAFYEAVAARFLSMEKDLRTLFQSRSREKEPFAKQSWSERDSLDLAQALEVCKLFAFGQGFLLIVRASELHNWGVLPATVAGVWKSGCIIRSRILAEMQEVFGKNHQASVFSDPFLGRIEGGLAGWRKVVGLGVSLGIPLPCMSSSLALYDGLRASVLPANFIQGIRDFFGSHGYTRVEQPHGQSCHADWNRSS